MNASHPFHLVHLCIPDMHEDQNLNAVSVVVFACDLIDATNFTSKEVRSEIR